MKFILVVTDIRRKNLVFVSKELHPLSLAEAVDAVRNGNVEGAYVVERKTGAYIRTRPKVPKREEFEKLSFKKLDGHARAYLYTYLIQPKHNIFFAAAYVRYSIDLWTPKIDLTGRPEILATLYSIGYGKPHSDPDASERGMQIVKEFYPLARTWLHEL